MNRTLEDHLNEQARALCNALGLCWSDHHDAILRHLTDLSHSYSQKIQELEKERDGAVQVHISQLESQLAEARKELDAATERAGRFYSELQSAVIQRDCLATELQSVRVSLDAIAALAGGECGK